MCTHSDEVAACERVRERVNELLLEAARAVCPDYCGLWASRREGVRPSPMPSGGGDLECRAPSTVWRKLLATSGGGTVRVTTVSEYGLRHEAEYTSAADLTRALVARLPDTSDVLADVRVRDNGRLDLTTQLHMRRQRAAGMLHCATCGGFYAGRRGLRDHQQIKHQTSYEEATEAVHAARGALVRYEHTAAEACLSRLWEARAAEAEAARRALSPGLAAARDGDVEALRSLAAAGWRAKEAVDRHGSTALMWAAGGGHLEACRVLVELGASPLAQQHKDARTAMHWAARNGHLEVCRWLVAQGCDADAPTRDGTTPLHWAVWQGRLGVCKYLVGSGLADVHARNSYGCNAVQWSAQSDGKSCEMCRWLHSAGLDLSVLNHNGHSAVHKAAIKGNRAVCEWLLSPEVGLSGVHLQADGDGNTPSRLARAEGYAALGEWLREVEAAHGVAAAEVCV